MISESSLEKLKILAGAAKYDVSCASSGTKRSNTQGGIGNAAFDSPLSQALAVTSGKLVVV
jgi:predicted DNA-binding helix-hairpin-helix protein